MYASTELNCSRTDNRVQPDKIQTDLWKQSSKHKDTGCSKTSLLVQRSVEDSKQTGLSKLCASSHGSRGHDARGADSNLSCDIGRKVVSATTSYNDYPNTTYGQTPMVASRELMVNSPHASGLALKRSHQDSRTGNMVREQSQEIHPVSFQQGHQYIKQTKGMSNITSLQDSRNTTEEFLSNAPQQGSALSAPRVPSPSHVHGSMVSNHNPSSHYANVRSFTTIANVSATPHADQCPNITSQSSLNRVIPEDVQEGNGPKQSYEIDGKGPAASPLIPDYPSPTFGQTAMVPSAELQTSMVTPPLHGERGASSINRTSGHDITDMHTPLQRTGSNTCDCRHDTPMPGMDD